MKSVFSKVVVLMLLAVLVTGCGSSQSPPPQDGTSMNAKNKGKANNAPAVEKFDTPPPSTGPKK